MLFRTFYLKLLTVVGLVGFNSAHADIVKRGAFDIGSGDTKITIADVDTDTNKIVKIHFQNYTTVPLRRDLASSADRTLSPEIQEHLIAVLQTYLKYPADQWFGIGTSVFRTATNGMEVLERIKFETGMTIHLASQYEEGEIGFQTAVAVSGLEEDQVIAWDSGSGSFQITAKHEGKMEMYGEEFAFISALEVLFTTIRQQSFDRPVTPNPVTKEEIERLAQIIQTEKLSPSPGWLAESDKTVVGFGGPSSLFAFGHIATGKERYTDKEVSETLDNWTGKTDGELLHFLEPHESIVGLTLLYSVMKHCGIKEVIYYPANGSCEGLLIMPAYWNKN